MNRRSIFGILFILFTLPLFANKELYMEDLGWKEFILFDDHIKLLLPDKPDEIPTGLYKHTQKYRKILLNKHYGVAVLNWSAGYFSVSEIVVRRGSIAYDVKESETQKGKIVVSIRHNQNPDGDTTVKRRRAVIDSVKTPTCPTVIELETWHLSKHYKNETQRQKCIKTAEEVFEKIVANVTVQLPDGTWAHPEIIRLPENIIRPDRYPGQRVDTLPSKP